MSCRTVLIWILLLLPVPGPLQAAGSAPSLAELTALGLEQNLGLKISRLTVSRQQQEVLIEDAQFDMELFAGSGLSRSQTPLAGSYSTLDTGENDQLSVRAGLARRFRSGLLAELSVETQWLSDNDVSEELDPRYRTALQIELNQPLLRNFGRDVNLVQLRQARSRERQQVLEYLLEARDLVFDLEIAARRLATGNAIIALRRDALALADNLLRANRERFAQGLIAVTQVQEAETAVAERRLALTRAEQERDLLFAELARSVNHQLPEAYRTLTLDDLAVIDLGGPAVHLEEMLIRSRERRLELKINATRLRRSRLQQSLAANQLQPQLDLSLSAGLNGLSGERRESEVSSPYSGSWTDSLGGMAEQDGFQWGAGLEFSVPLGNRQARARLQQARLQVRADRYQAQDLEAQLKDELRQQQINLLSGREQLDIAERFVQLAQRSLKQEERRVEEGLSDTFRLISYQEKLTDAHIRQLETLVSYQLAEARMALARGLFFQRHGIVLSASEEEIALDDF